MYQNAPYYQAPHHRPPVVALLLDAENISSSHLDFVVDKAGKYGALLIRRAYADWSIPQVESYRNGLKKHAFFAVHQFSGYSGKNSSDMAMSIDAMDLAYKSKPDIMVLATSDSDFTPLVIKLREMGVQVIGIGNPNVAKSLVGACNDFHYIPILPKNSPPPKFMPAGSAIAKPKPIAPESAPAQKAWRKDPNKDSVVIEILNELIDTKADAQGRVNSALIGWAFNARNINVSDYGCDKVTALVGQLNDFEIVVDNSTHYLQRRHATPAEPQAVATPKARDANFVDGLAQGILANQEEFGWAKVGRVAIFARQQLGIHAMDYGYETLSDAIVGVEAFELYRGEKGDYVRDVRAMAHEWADKTPAEIGTLPPQYQNAIQVVPNNTKEKLDDVPSQPAPKADLPDNHTSKDDEPQDVPPVSVSDNPPPAQKEPNAQVPANPHNKAKQPLTKQQITQLRDTIHKIMADNPERLEWISLSNIGVGLRKGGIEPKQFGVKNFSALIDKMGCFETKTLNTVLCLKNPFFVREVAPADTPVVTEADVDSQVQAVPVDNIEPATEPATEEVVADVVPDTVPEVVAETTQITPTDAPQVHEETLNSHEEVFDAQEDSENAQAREEKAEPSIDHEVSDDRTGDDMSLSEVLAVINDAISAHQDDDGYAKVGDIGKYVRNAIGLGAMSFGYADFGKMLSPLPQYEVTRMGRFMVVRLKVES